MVLTSLICCALCLSEFLNADDEADYNEEADDALNPEEAQSLENSGWSSRTR